MIFYLEFQDKCFYICAMIKLKGYDAVEYDTFQGVLYDAYKRSGMTYFELAYQIKVNSTQTPANAFNDAEQTVSDQVLTNIVDKLLGESAFVAWIGGERYYYIKSKLTTI